MRHCLRLQFQWLHPLLGYRLGVNTPSIPNLAHGWGMGLVQLFSVSSLMNHPAKYPWALSYFLYLFILGSSPFLYVQGCDFLFLFAYSLNPICALSFWHSSQFQFHCQPSHFQCQSTLLIFLLLQHLTELRVEGVDASVPPATFIQAHYYHVNLRNNSFLYCSFCSS